MRPEVYRWRIYWGLLFFCCLACLGGWGRRYAYYQSHSQFRQGKKLWDLDTREGYRSAVLAYEKSARFSRLLGDRDTEGAALHNAGVLYLILDQPEQAVEALKKAISLKSSPGTAHGETRTIFDLGRAYQRLGEMQEAQHCFQKALTFAREAYNQDQEKSVLNSIGNLYLDRRLYQEAISYYNKARSLPPGPSENEDLNAVVQGNLGRTYAEAGQFQQGLQLCQEALALHETLGKKGGQVAALGNIGWIYYKMNQPAKAMEYYHQAQSLNTPESNKRSEASLLDDIGLVYFKQGETQKAISSCEQALALEKQAQDRLDELNTLKDLGDIYARVDADAARSYYEQALPLCRKIGDSRTEAEVLAGIRKLNSGKGI